MLRGAPSLVRGTFEGGPSLRGMLIECYDHAMSNLQVKRVPPELHAALRARARERGLSLRDLVLEILWTEITRPSRAEWAAAVRELPEVRCGDAAEWVRAERDERE